MSEGVPLDLVAAVRRLVEVDSAIDPDHAAEQFDQLVTMYGRAQAAAALTYVAPHALAELVREQRHSANHQSNSRYRPRHRHHARSPVTTARSAGTD
jgi:hypothetical protein